MQTGTLLLKCTDGPEIYENSIMPGWNTTKIVSIENIGMFNAFYALKWKSLVNTISSNELVMRATCVQKYNGIETGKCDDIELISVGSGPGIIKENTGIPVGYTHEYTITFEFLYLEKDQNYNQNQGFNGVLNIASSNGINAATYFENNENTIGITTIAHNITGNQNYNSVDYRFQGGEGCVVVMNAAKCTSLGGTLEQGALDEPLCYSGGGDRIIPNETQCNDIDGTWNSNTPNNYIEFNNELWGIVGIFDVDDGMGNVESRLKIMRDSSLGNIFFSYTKLGTNYNSWKDSTMMSLLNSEAYYNETTASTNNDCSSGSAECDYSNNGLNTEAKSLIKNAVWYLGNVNHSLGASSIYTSERSNTVYPSNSATWIGQVGLVYASDYAMSSSLCYSDNTIPVYYYWRHSCIASNWMNTGNYQWTISPNTARSNDLAFIRTQGNISANTAHDVNDTRPALYLIPEALFSGGKGTQTDPYRILK